MNLDQQSVCRQVIGRGGKAAVATIGENIPLVERER
jgi:hypothetical protein